MELYGHRTSGGAQYYYTTNVDCSNGEKESTFDDIILRTDGGILELSNYKKKKKYGFHTLILPNGDKIDID